MYLICTGPSTGKNGSLRALFVACVLAHLTHLALVHDPDKVTTKLTECWDTELNLKELVTKMLLHRQNGNIKLHHVYRPIKTKKY